MEYKTFATRVALQAGKLIKNNFSLHFKAQWKDDFSPVTAVDEAISTFVINEITQHYPQHGILSEEVDDIINPTSSLIWVCDPIDGTYPFAHGIPTAMFSLALVENGQTIMAVNYDPFLNRMYYAEKGKGAFLNDQPITVSSATSIDKSIVGISIWGHAQYDLSPLVSAFQNANTLPINLASNVYMGSLVAAGSLSGIIYNDNKAHDTAAIKLLVEEAGGKVTDLHGNDQRYDGAVKGLVATNGILHDTFLELIQKHIV